MVELVGIKEGIGVKIRKGLVAPSAYGSRKYGAFHYGAGANIHGIYRVRHDGIKIIQERMPFYVPTNPQTVPQQANRQKLTDAVVAWQGLTGPQKAVYNQNAIGKGMSGYNLFLSEYLYSN